MSKERNTYGQKSVGITHLKIDEESRTVEGVFADFNFIDSDADLLSPTCCDKSIQEHGPGTDANRKIAHLAFHDVRRPVGVIEELKVNENNQLQFKSVLGSHTDGEDALRMYKEGIVREHSIGFKYEKLDFISLDQEKINNLDQRNDVGAVAMYGGYYNVSEIKLFEGSFVTFGANSNTPNLSIIKSQQDVNNELEKLFERMDKLNKALTDGNYQKTYNGLFTVEIEQIKSSIKSLVQFEPPKKALETEQSDSGEAKLKSYYLQKLSK